MLNGARLRRMMVPPVASAPQAVVDMARDQATNLRTILGTVPPPPELLALETSVEKGAASVELGQKMFELLCTMTLDFVTDPVSKTVKPAENPEVLEKTPELQSKMTYLYTYGMRMLTGGLMEIDTLKDLVVEKLATRVGMTGEELDAWLDV